MCGLFGFSGKKGKPVNTQKLIVLGLYNEMRGTDSCGYYFNGNIEKGVGVDSDFSDFISSTPIKSGKLKSKTFLGHTRKSTAGLNNIENAHPHIINDEYVQTHNGVINGIWPLCRKYGIDSGEIHVDSIALAHLIYKEGPKPILDEYKGFAALAFTWTGAPEVLYLYHGASRDKKDGTILEERPLFVLLQPEGIYYSSIKASLNAINTSTDADEPFSLKHNVVWEIANGEFTGNQIAIERENNNIPESLYVVPKEPYMLPSSSYKTHDKRWFSNKVLDFEDDDKNENDLIKTETFPVLSKIDINKVIYNKGRYYVVKIAASGVLYTHLLEGTQVINRKGFVVDEDTVMIQNQSSVEERFYFISGFMMKSHAVYEKLKNDNINSGFTDTNLKILSAASRFPIIQLQTNFGVGSNRWYKDGKRVRKGTYDPKFTDRKYKIKDGRTVKII